MHVFYRVRQFWLTISSTPTDEELKKAQAVLSPELYSLFHQLQPSEQAHSLEVYNNMLALGYENEDLLDAALLHDIGKNRCPLHLWERVLIVLGKAMFPQRSKGWGGGEPKGWRRAFVIADQHPNWGAEMAANSGASEMTVELIKRHQEILPEKNNSDYNSLENQLLQRLQTLDNTS